MSRRASGSCDNESSGCLSTAWERDAVEQLAGGADDGLARTLVAAPSTSSSRPRRRSRSGARRGRAGRSDAVGELVPGRAHRHRDADGAQDADRGVRAVRDERAGGDRAAGARRGHDRHLRHGRCPARRPGPSADPAASRTDSTVDRSVSSAARSSGVSCRRCRGRRRAAARPACRCRHRSPRCPRTASTSMPVGQTGLSPTREGEVDRRGGERGARHGGVAVVAHPALRRPNLRPRRRFGEGFTMRMRTVVVSPATATRPRSMANGPTPASRLPQFCASVTTARSGTSCRNR